MSDPTSLETRLERLEEQVRQSGGSRIERALRFLPWLAAAHVMIGAPTLLLTLVLAYATFVQADATRKMQVGGALPFVSYGSSNASVNAAGEAVISLDLSNNGVGPALLGPIEIRYEGEAVANAHELLRRCCGMEPGQGQSITVSSTNGIAVRPGEAVGILRIARTPANQAVWDRFDTERWKLQVRSCYCSIFDDCWVIDGAQSRPGPVESCPTDWSPYAEDAAPRDAAAASRLRGTS